MLAKSAIIPRYYRAFGKQMPCRSRRCGTGIVRCCLYSKINCAASRRPSTPVRRWLPTSAGSGGRCTAARRPFPWPAPPQNRGRNRRSSQRGAGSNARLPADRQAQLHLTFGVDVAQTQQAVKIARHTAFLRPGAVSVEHRDWPTRSPAAAPRRAKASSAVYGAVCQRAGRAGGDVVLHIFLGQRGKAVAAEIKPSADVIFLDTGKPKIARY